MVQAENGSREKSAGGAFWNRRDSPAALEPEKGQYEIRERKELCVESRRTVFMLDGQNRKRNCVRGLRAGRVRKHRAGLAAASSLSHKMCSCLPLPQPSVRAWGLFA